jgi:hypothetical protein
MSIDCLTLFGYCSDYIERLDRDSLLILIETHDVVIPEPEKKSYIETIQDAINTPFERWKGNCYHISCQIVKSGIIKGKAVFGKYYGQVDDQSMFAGGIFINHGWIETPEGKIIDPTRWVFENKEPYIFETDKNNKDYDRGSNFMKSIFNNAIPAFDESTKIITIEDESIDLLFSAILGEHKQHKKITVDQAVFIGSQSLDFYGENAKTIFTWFKENNLAFFIPIDNYDMIMES